MRKDNTKANFRIWISVLNIIQDKEEKFQEKNIWKPSEKRKKKQKTDFFKILI